MHAIYEQFISKALKSPFFWLYCILLHARENRKKYSTCIDREYWKGKNNNVIQFMTQNLILWIRVSFSIKKSLVHPHRNFINLRKNYYKILWKGKKCFVHLPFDYDSLLLFRNIFRWPLLFIVYFRQEGEFLGRCARLWDYLNFTSTLVVQMNFNFL